MLSLHSSLTNPPRLPGLSLGSVASALAPLLLHQGQNLHINSEDQSRRMHFSMVMYCPANISSLTLHYSSLGNCIPSPYQADTCIHAINSVPLRSDTITPSSFVCISPLPLGSFTQMHMHTCAYFSIHPPSILLHSCVWPIAPPQSRLNIFKEESPCHSHLSLLPGTSASWSGIHYTVTPRDHCGRHEDQ